MNNLSKLIVVVFLSILHGCSIHTVEPIVRKESIPDTFSAPKDSAAFELPQWKLFYQDSNLLHLIELGLSRNQELSLFLQELEIRKNEVRVRKGEYLPFVGVASSAGLDRIPKYTWKGGVEDNLSVQSNEKVFSSQTDYVIGVRVGWELDVWRRLRNAKKAAWLRYLSTNDGKNFLITQLVAEIASTYYELVALDNQWQIVNRNVEIQFAALEAARLLKQSAKVTQLAVNRFEAQWLSTQSLRYPIQQQIVEAENRLRFLTGSDDLLVKRSSLSDMDSIMPNLKSGFITLLLSSRPDIQQAEKEIVACGLDVASARAAFYPSFSIEGFLGMEAVLPRFLFNPSSLLYSLASGITSPVINRNALKANLYNANANQVKSIVNYNKCLLSAYLEAITQFNLTENLTRQFIFVANEAEVLQASVAISVNLFKSAHADYLEVLLTQQEALHTLLELNEIRLSRWKASVSLYKVLGGGWR